MDKSIWRQCKRKNRYRDEHTANLYRRKYEQERDKEFAAEKLQWDKEYHERRMAALEDLKH